jgi:hypothetical protein
VSNWRRIMRRAAYWTLPPGVLDLARGKRPEAKPLLRREDVALVQANQLYRGKHRDERVFILASGPSIQKQDLSGLRGEKCISVSNFFVHPLFQEIRPLYHCIAPLHPPFTDDDGVRWFNQMESRMAGTTFFLGITDRRLIEGNGLLPSQTIRYLDFSGDWNKNANTGFDLSRPLPFAQSVSIIALMVALYLGFKQIYLLGTDHTFLNADNGKYDYHHFYADPKANALGQEPPAEDLENLFACQATLWQQYKALRSFARSQGVSIFNASAGGILDLFPRVRLDDVTPPRHDL